MNNDKIMIQDFFFEYLVLLLKIKKRNYER